MAPPHHALLLLTILILYSPRTLTMVLDYRILALEYTFLNSTSMLKRPHETSVFRSAQSSSSRNYIKRSDKSSL
jgi:hypothetical protein